jgi:hypothetical protein
MFSFTLRPLYPCGKPSGQILDSRLGVLQSRSVLCEDEKSFVPLLGIEPQFLGWLPPSLTGIPTELSRPITFVHDIFLNVKLRGGLSIVSLLSYFEKNRIGL